MFSSFIGTKLAGVNALGNREGGVLISGRAYRNSIGNAKSRPANLISGNTGNGVTPRAGTRRNRVINNYIGLDRFGRRLPNSGHAVINKGRGNTIRVTASPDAPDGRLAVITAACRDALQ